MAGLIKELLLDYSMNRLSIDQRSDISTAIFRLQRAGILNNTYMHILDAYLSGYDAMEIAIATGSTTEHIETILTRIFLAIEHASGYTDEVFVRGIERTKKYSKERVIRMGAFLQQHGKQFLTHDIVKV